MLESIEGSPRPKISEREIEVNSIKTGAGLEK